MSRRLRLPWDCNPRYPTGHECQAAWGRPADVLVMPDGSLLVSDDYAGAIYRITYRG